MHKQVIFCCIALLTGLQGLNAQNSKQIQYLLKQIAELQVYLGYVKKGYDIVESGLHNIHSIKNGEFGLHDAYYTSLRNVNPHIRQSPYVAGIISHQQYIQRATSALKKVLNANNTLLAKQKEYVQKSCDRLQGDVEKTRQALLALVTNRTLEMTDDQRIQRLNALYTRSRSQKSFIQQFSAEVVALLKSLQGEETEQESIKQFHGLPK